MLTTRAMVAVVMLVAVPVARLMAVVLTVIVIVPWGMIMMMVLTAALVTLVMVVSFGLIAGCVQLGGHLIADEGQINLV